MAKYTFANPLRLRQGELLRQMERLRAELMFITEYSPPKFCERALELKRLAAELGELEIDLFLEARQASLMAIRRGDEPSARRNGSENLFLQKSMADLKYV